MDAALRKYAKPLGEGAGFAEERLGFIGLTATEAERAEQHKGQNQIAKCFGDLAAERPQATADLQRLRQVWLSFSKPPQLNLKIANIPQTDRKVSLRFGTIATKC